MFIFGECGEPAGDEFYGLVDGIHVVELRLVQGYRGEHVQKLLVVEERTGAVDQRLGIGLSLFQFQQHGF